MWVTVGRRVLGEVVALGGVFRYESVWGREALRRVMEKRGGVECGVGMIKKLQW